MAKIYPFEIRRARPGGVLCPPLGITFPVVTRIVQSLSREELDGFGVTDVEPDERFIHYTLTDESSADRYPGTIERASIRGMPDQEGPSLVIRRHTSEEHAFDISRRSTTSPMKRPMVPNCAELTRGCLP